MGSTPLPWETLPGAKAAGNVSSALSEGRPLPRLCPCIDLAEGAGTWRAAILEHKAMFMSGLPGTHGWTPKVRYAPGNGSGCGCACGSVVCAWSCVLSLEAEAYSSQL